MIARFGRSFKVPCRQILLERNVIMIRQRSHPRVPAPLHAHQHRPRGDPHEARTQVGCASDDARGAVRFGSEHVYESY